MDVSDWISLIGALASLVLTIVIAVVQYKQSKKIASMERVSRIVYFALLRGQGVDFLVCNSRYVQSPPLLFAADVP